MKAHSKNKLFLDEQRSQDSYLVLLEFPHKLSEFSSHGSIHELYLQQVLVGKILTI